jgi:tetratricopeptide (TPR) repeat protein
MLEAMGELRALRDDLLIIPTRPLPAEIRARAAIVLVPLLQIEGPRALIASLCTDALGTDLPPALVWKLRLALGERARLAGRWADADEQFGLALAAAEQVEGLARAEVLLQRSFAWVDGGRAAAAEPVLREILDVFRAAGDEVLEADASRYLAKRWASEHDEAASELEQVRQQLLRIGDPLRLYHLHRDLAGVHLARGELDAAEARVRASIGWARDLNLRRGESDGVWWLAQITRQRGDLGGADRLLVDAHAGYQSLGEDERARLMTRLRALLWVEGGLFDAAEQTLSQAYHETPEADALYRAIDLANLAVVWHLQDRRDAAIQAFRRLLEQAPAGPMRVAVQLHLAAAHADDDQVDEAEAMLHAALGDQPPSGALAEVCGQVVDLACARAGRVDRGVTLAAARETAARLRAPAPNGGPGIARRDQDASIACLALERAIERTSRAPLRSETNGRPGARPPR